MAVFVVKYETFEGNKGCKVIHNEITANHLLMIYKRDKRIKDATIVKIGN